MGPGMQPSSGVACNVLSSRQGDSWHIHLSKNMLFLESFCAMSMMVSSTKILIILMDDWRFRSGSLRCVFFFFLYFILCDRWLGSESRCFLESCGFIRGWGGRCVWVSARDSHQVVSAQRKRENKRQESSICSNTMVLNFSESAIVVLLLLFHLSLFLNSFDT
jgi:hypothetical protein